MDSQLKVVLKEKLANRNDIGGNLLVCWTMFKHSRLRSTSNIFIACLAFSDVLIAVLGFPFTLAVLLTGRWPFNKAACNFQGFAFTVFGTLSLFTITLTAIV